MTNAYWVGVPGEPSAEQIDALVSAGLAQIGKLRQIRGGYGNDWDVLRTYFRTPGDTPDDAVRKVAEVLDLDVSHLSSHSAGMFD